MTETTEMYGTENAKKKGSSAANSRRWEDKKTYLRLQRGWNGKPCERRGGGHGLITAQAHAPCDSSETQAPPSERRGTPGLISEAGSRLGEN